MKTLNKIIADYEAVIFDLDGVITDTASYHFQAWKTIADDLNIPFDENDNEHLKGVDRIASLNYILKLGNKQLAEDEFAKALVLKNQRYQTLIQTVSTDDLLPGAIDVLEALKQHQLKLGVASASQNAPSIISRLGIGDYFNHIADASLARSKPAPDIFLFAAYGLNVHPEKCAAIEDSIAGLKAIKQSSMLAIGVGESYLASHAEICVGSLLELVE